jgi:hypothetical protein
VSDELLSQVVSARRSRRAANTEVAAEPTPEEFEEAISVSSAGSN